jgi:hypothetical protein
MLLNRKSFQLSFDYRSSRSLVMESLSSDSNNLTWTNVAVGLTFILFDVGVSTVLRLGVGISLLVAALRCIGQLALVATVLQRVFEHKNPWSVAGIACEIDLSVIENDSDGELQVVLNLLGTIETGKVPCIYMFSIFHIP